MLGIITGTGFYDLPFLTEGHVAQQDTPYGPVTATTGMCAGHAVAFLARHGGGHSVPPHRVNYRANIWALRELGVTAIVATAVSGGIDPAFGPGALVNISDFLDFTRGRPDTFFDDEVHHTDVSAAYAPDLRALLADGARAAGVALHPEGVYVCANGPRFETPAEIRAYRVLGAQLVGMTGYPEVTLAAEVGIPYASIGVISNPAAGLGDPITLDEIRATLADAKPSVLALLEAVARSYRPTGTATPA